MSKNKTLIIYNRDGAECDTKFPICDIEDFFIWTYPDHEVVTIIDTKGERHRVELKPTIEKLQLEDGSFVECYVTTFRTGL